MDLVKLQAIVNDSCGLSGNSKILVGVSGGPDSLCLVDSLARLGYPLVVAHFDHMLRSASASDADTVADFAHQLGLPFVIGRQDVAGFSASERVSIEEAARMLRYRFLFDQARLTHAQAVAVGHTADDQAETVLMHLLRGAGLRGLIGMSHRTTRHGWDPDIPLVRPLLAVWRAETVAYCLEMGLQPVYDATNQDLVYFRNRIRHELIPALETYNPRLRQAIWRMADLLAEDEEIVSLAVDQAWKACFFSQDPGEVLLRLDVVQGLAAGLRRRVLRKSLEQLLTTSQEIDYAAIQRAEQFIRKPTSGQVELVQGLRVSVEQNMLVIANDPGSRAHPDWPRLIGSEEQVMPIPGLFRLAGGWQVAAEWVERDGLLEWVRSTQHSAWEAWLDAASIPGEITMRCARPGDRIQPLGMHGRSMKLSDFWINRKLPRPARTGWPVLVCAGQIMWAPGFQPADPFRLQPKTRKALHLSCFRV